MSDNGRGIDPALLPQIFDSFGRSGSPGVPPGAGLGLGLTIVRSMIELHGGTVTARSEGLGHGSTFEVRLPALVSSRAEVPSRPRPPAPPVVSRRILIVDDNREAAESMGDALRPSGHEVVLAYRAEEALSRLESFVPDVALLDIGLPDMNGRELGGRLRQRNAEMKLIAVTGFGQPSDCEASRRAGFAAHMVKPVGVRELLDLIRT